MAGGLDHEATVRSVHEKRDKGKKNRGFRQEASLFLRAAPEKPDKCLPGTQPGKPTAYAIGWIGNSLRKN